MDDLVKELSKTKRLQYELLRELREIGHAPHRRFLSEREIIERYRLNRTTVRQALGSLVERGYLYRVNGKGTFVAPKAKGETLLVVADLGENPFNSGRYAVLEFTGGVTARAQSEDSAYVPHIVQPASFLNNLGDLDLIYKHLAGVVFYSDPGPLVPGREALERKEIPYVFYGSNQSVPEGSPQAYCYNQEKIVAAALDYLFDQGHRGIGIIYFKSNAPRTQRVEEYTRWHQKRGIPVPPEFYIEISYGLGLRRELKYQELRQQLSGRFPVAGMTAVFCVDDLLALYFINTVVNAGYKVPQDISVVGVNNYPFCPDVITPLTTVEIPFYEDGKRCFELFAAALKGGPQVRGESSHRLVERASVRRVGEA